MRVSGQSVDNEWLELIDRARDLVPVIRERAPGAELKRRISDVSNQAFKEAGLYRIYQPARFGGYQATPRLLLDVAAEIGRGCGSSAWLVTNMAAQAWVCGLLELETQEELWADDPKTLIASSFPNPDATVTPVAGGIVVDGKWSFASGIDHADWNNLQVMVPQESGSPKMSFALVHKSEFEVVDDWYVSGLAATGSRSLLVNEVFIPERRMSWSSYMQGGWSPGGDIHQATVYRLPLWGVGNKLFSGPIVGLARGAVEVMEQHLQTQRNVGGLRIAEQPSVHLRIAEASAEVEAAWTLLRKDCDEAAALVNAGTMATLDDRVRWRRNDAFAAKLCISAVEGLFPLAGARGLATSNHFMRAWRDIHAALSQITMVWDINALNYGKVRFGIPFFDPRLWPFQEGESPN
ncbi:MAG: acyl-CoA dehydrogenase family protein [Planctomycetota bacterium]|jgi:3-hydroxy-9,10-secoandrosta-1,3,5(10)-triene-9,17-dione monooxygenase